MDRGTEDVVDPWSGDSLLAVEFCLMLFLLGSIPLPKLMPGKPGPASPFGVGVAAGSTETTDRTGKTRSVASRLRAESVEREVGYIDVSVAPDNMLREPVPGIIPNARGRGVASSDRGASDTERQRQPDEDFPGD